MCMVWDWAAGVLGGSRWRYEVVHYVGLGGCGAAGELGGQSLAGATGLTDLQLDDNLVGPGFPEPLRALTSLVRLGYRLDSTRMGSR